MNQQQQKDQQSKSNKPKPGIVVVLDEVGNEIKEDVTVKFYLYRQSYTEPSFDPSPSRQPHNAMIRYKSGMILDDKDMKQCHWISNPDMSEGTYVTINGGLVICIIETTGGDKAAGIAICCNGDRFSAKIGKRIARERAVEAIYKYGAPVYPVVIESKTVQAVVDGVLRANGISTK